MEFLEHAARDTPLLQVDYDIDEQHLWPEAGFFYDDSDGKLLLEISVNFHKSFPIY